MKKLLLLLALITCAAIAHAQDAPNACNDGKCIQIGSYNIELFGNPRASRRDDEVTPTGPKLASKGSGLINLSHAVGSALDLKDTRIPPQAS